MRSILRTVLVVAAGAAVLTLSGCVVAPPYAGYGYGGGGYYAPAPVVVSPSVGFYGRWGGGGRYWR
ncbi:hypothetical protein GT347_00970 [Xylophilus rhododendri]|uniref:Lipoprotein n=1 Tax=Xylophilus rhododendri TaxID=2697032 RepID=A0A857IZ04_9BURK|nr:hypothetical protein GT347_00970 [Xylophilus rhododendri]